MEIIYLVWSLGPLLDACGTCLEGVDSTFCVMSSSGSDFGNSMVVSGLYCNVHVLRQRQNLYPCICGKRLYSCVKGLSTIEYQLFAALNMFYLEAALRHR